MLMASVSWRLKETLMQHVDGVNNTQISTGSSFILSNIFIEFRLTRNSFGFDWYIFMRAIDHLAKTR